MGSKKHKKFKSDDKQGSDSDGDDGGHVEKPLKLVLKVGSQRVPTHDENYGALSPSSQSEERSRHKHKKKKKKKSEKRDKSRQDEHQSLKRTHEEVESNDEEDDEEEDEEERDEVKDEIKDEEEEEVRGTDYDGESDGNSSPSRRLRERTIKDSDGIILKQMLNYLIKNLQNKDVNGFFAFPVTDSIAPGYSSIITNPMDFSSMSAKIEAEEYSNVMDFKKDFILMCNNCMTYNRQDTIYYKEAKKLLHLGIRQLSKEKLLHLKKTQSFLSSITLQELGFDESGHVITVEQLPSSKAPVENKPPPPPEPKPERDIDRFDTIPDDDLSPEEILSQAQDAAQAAKNALSARKPKTDLGFLRLEDDGTTSMTILNPWNDGVVSSTQKVISLGDYMGKLKSGSGSLFKFKEDKRNKVCPETYLCYGPFSSHAPSYDSSFASCTKEESDLLLQTYDGEIGVQYAKSVQKFVENAGISAIEMVDKLLDTLTSGQHSKSKVMLEEQKKKEEKAAEQALQDEMIVKAQKAAEEAAAAEKEAKEKKVDTVQQNLNSTAAMISDLYHTQTQRLSQDPPRNLNYIAQPSATESDLANKVTNQLVSMAKQVNPKDVVSTSAVRGAMGITQQPVAEKKQQVPLSTGVSKDGSSVGKVKGGNRSDNSEDEGKEDEVDDDDDDDEDSEDENMQVPAPVNENRIMGSGKEMNRDNGEESQEDEVDGGTEMEDDDEDDSDEEDMEEGDTSRGGAAAQF